MTKQILTSAIFIGVAAALSGATPPPLDIRSLLETKPTAKVVSDEIDCGDPVDVVALAGDDLVSYLRTTSWDCLELSVIVRENPSIRNALPTIYGDENMQSVFSAIEELTPGYDGTNDAGLYQLWRFARTGFTYNRWFRGETGVGPYNEETERAYIAASDAFGSSDHFHSINDEAARIGYEYIESAYDYGLREHHVLPINRILSGFTAERSARKSEVCSTPSSDGSFICWTDAPHQTLFSHTLDRINGAFRDSNQGNKVHEEFLQAIKSEAGFIDALSAVTRHDFYFLADGDDPFTRRLQTLEYVIEIIGLLTRDGEVGVHGVAALISVLSWHERLSSPFLAAVKYLEAYVDDCESLDICRDTLEREIIEHALPNTYTFDDGAIVFQTSLDLEEMIHWYYEIKIVEAQFHRLVETDEIADEDRDVFTARIYDSQRDYTPFEHFLSNADTRGIHSGGIYTQGTMAAPLRVGDTGDFPDTSAEEAIRHEYVHYLAERFGLLGIGNPGLSTFWFDEGLAEFLVASTQADGVRIRSDHLSYVLWDDPRLSLEEMFFAQYVFCPIQ